MFLNRLKTFTDTGNKWFTITGKVGCQYERNGAFTRNVESSYRCSANVLHSRQISNINHNSSRSTIDASQVEVLTKFNDEWWDPNGTIRALHAYNEIRLPFIRDGLLGSTDEQSGLDNKDFPLRGLKLLDVGCGGGILTESLAKLGGRLVGLDAADILLQSARSHASLDPTLTGNLSYVHSTIEEHAEYFPETYDGVVVSEVLEHIPDKDLFLENCARALKPGGSIFFTTFNRTFLSWLCGIILAENVLNCIPKGTHEFRLFISPENTALLLKKYKCETVSVRGINYNPFKNKWYWVNHRQISYGLHAIKRYETREK